MCVDFVRVAMAAGEPDDAAQVARTVEAVTARSGVRGAAGIGLHCRGLVPSRVELAALMRETRARGDV